MNRNFWLSLGATLLPLPFLLVGSRIPLPGVDPYSLDLPASEAVMRPSLSVLSLGIMPAVTAFILVELVALAVPRWRRLRHDREGRRKLRRAALGLTLAITLYQAYSVAQALQYFSMRAGIGSLLMLLVTLTGGVFVLVALADWIDRRSFVSGLGTMLVWTQVARTLEQQRPAPDLFFREASADAQQALALGLVACVIGIATAFVLRRPVVAASTPGPDAISLRAPLCGVIPFYASATVMTMLWSVRPVGEKRTLDAAYDFFSSGVGSAVLLAPFVLGFSYLFNDPSRVAALWERAFRPAPAKKKKKTKAKDAKRAPASEDAPRDAYAPPRSEAPLPSPVPFVQAVIPTVIYVAILYLAHLATVQLAPIAVSAVAFALAGALAVDAIEAGLFIARHGAVVSVRVEVRPAAADPALLALEKKAIPALARGRHLATLLQFFGPFAPMDIRVPEAHAAAAAKLLDRALGSASDPASSAASASSSASGSTSSAA